MSSDNFHDAPTPPLNTALICAPPHASYVRWTCNLQLKYSRNWGKCEGIQKQKVNRMGRLHQANIYICTFTTCLSSMRTPFHVSIASRFMNLRACRRTSTYTQECNQQYREANPTNTPNTRIKCSANHNT